MEADFSTSKDKLSVAKQYATVLDQRGAADLSRSSHHDLGLKAIDLIEDLLRLRLKLLALAGILQSFQLVGNQVAGCLCCIDLGLDVCVFHFISRLKFD